MAKQRTLIEAASWRFNTMVIGSPAEADEALLDLTNRIGLCAENHPIILLPDVRLVVDGKLAVYFRIIDRNHAELLWLAGDAMGMAA